jgi:hypothetical protein
MAGADRAEWSWYQYDSDATWPKDFPWDKPLELEPLPFLDPLRKVTSNRKWPTWGRRAASGAARSARRRAKMASANRKAALTHRIRTAAGKALAACPEERWPVLEGRVEDVHRLCDEGDLDHAVVMLLAFLCQNPDGVEEFLDELHDFAKRLSLGPAGERMLAQLTHGD